ncbi:SpoIIE family protein phosphatase [Clostridium sp. D2Q-11]|uniref:SpoIIE family protein phosphatase n=1 Tax=Anaeromonas frigoriresistens TaxID=2683708 RepID=A0A942Z8R2_9FIRM|nr:MASE3 domain-containing protein [Anaeromonas frigoriresistens]MBS4538269.1 SpoIIE family protein phosphatase [Anaeromonas frigoriresistens]
MINKRVSDFRLNKDYFQLIYTLIFGIAAISLVSFTNFFHLVLDKELFLVFHTLLEISSVLIAFSIFLALYNIYDYSDRIRNIIFANTFFIVGVLDTFHLLSYKGMPDFITTNIAQKATAYWIFSRLIMALGILLASLFSDETRTDLNKKYFLLVSVIISVGLGYLIVYENNIIPALFVEGSGLTMTKIVLEYIITLLFIISILLIGKRNARVSHKLNITMISALILSVFSEVMFTAYINVHDGINVLGHVFKTLSYFIIFKVLFIENIRDPYMRVSKMREDLKSYVDKLEGAVKEKTEEMAITNYKLKDMNNRMLNELESAKQIQMALIPKKDVKHLGVEFNSDYIPCGKLSGDFYKYFKIDDKHVGMFLIDVSGHGVSSAMLTIFADRVLTPFDDEVDKDFYLNPGEVLKDFYEVFNESDFPDETHMVLVYSVLNIETNEFVYSSAGHNCKPIHIKNNGEVEILELKDGFPICKLGDVFVPEFTNQKINLSKGDRILLYTDGVIEIQNKDKEQYGIERLLELTTRKKYLTSRGILNKISDDLNRFRGKIDIDDDITMFIMNID